MEMEGHVPTLCRVGRISVTDEVNAEGQLRNVPRSFYSWLHKSARSSFAFLAAERLEVALDFMRALVLAEKMDYSGFPGSASLLIPA